MSQHCLGQHSVACMSTHACFCTQAGGGVQLCPDAQVDDGKLDVTYILNPNLEDVPKILTGLQSAHLRPVNSTPYASRNDLVQRLLHTRGDRRLKGGK
jgi:YegS C-terminal NAD kinase beta sandwich-like domain